MYEAKGRGQGPVRLLRSVDRGGQPGAARAGGGAADRHREPPSAGRLPARGRCGQRPDRRASRPWSAGTWTGPPYRPTCSSDWPRRPASSSRSASACWNRHQRRPRAAGGRRRPDLHQRQHLGPPAPGPVVRPVVASAVEPCRGPASSSRSPNGRRSATTPGAGGDAGHLGHGRAVRDRRLRCRLLLDQLPARAAGARRQDRRGAGRRTSTATPGRAPCSARSP